MCGINDIYIDEDTDDDQMATALDVRHRANDEDIVMATPDEDRGATNEPGVADATYEPRHGATDEETAIDAERWRRHVDWLQIRLDLEEIEYAHSDLVQFLHWVFRFWQQMPQGTHMDLMHTYRWIWRIQPVRT